MKTRLRWEQAARTDLETIVRGRREFGRASARRLRQELLTAIDNLRDFPDLGRQLAVDAPSGIVRQLVVSDYLVQYRRLADSVLVVSIRHGRMDTKG